MSTAFPLDLKPRWRLPSDLGFTPGVEPDAYMLGDIWVERHRVDSVTEAITITDASPRLLIGDELLQDIQFDLRRYNTCAWVTLEENELAHELKPPGECPSCSYITITATGDLEPMHCFSNMLLYVNARNRRLVYRIGDYRPRSRTWEAAWPD